VAASPSAASTNSFTRFACAVIVVRRPFPGAEFNESL
jgi:hypothetical protein